MSEKVIINRLPTRTWNRLGVNETALTWEDSADLGSEQVTAAGQAVRLDISGDGTYSEKRVDIHAPEGQTVTVFETLRSEDKLLVRTELHIEKNARVRLVQIQDTAQGSLLRLETDGRCAENGQVELIQILLGRGDVYSDGHFALNGTGAGFQAGIGYLGQKQQTGDLNLVVDHWGQKTTSEINAAGAVGLHAAIDYVNRIGFTEMHRRELALTRRAMEGIRDIPGVHVLGSEKPEEHCGILAFTVDGVHPHDISEILASDGVAIRAGHHCAQPLLAHLGHPSTARASLAFYNTEAEIDRLLNSLSTLRERMGYGK